MHNQTHFVYTWRNSSASFAGFTLLLIFMTTFSLPIWAEVCTPLERIIVLNTQSEVDNFQSDYGPCDQVDFLRVTGADIVNLDGLSALTSVLRQVIISDNPNLTDIGGLANLNSVSGLLGIKSNNALTNIDGLAAFTSWGGHLRIESNATLTNVDGLSSVTEVGGYLEIKSNPALTNVDGLSNLTSVGSNLKIEYNALLDKCTGLSRLVDQWDDAKPGPGPGAGGVPDVGNEVRINFNSVGCNSIQEILATVNPSMINAGLNDVWYNQTTSGQGFFITVFPDIGYVSLSWFTYDTERPPEDVTAKLGDPGHRWLNALGTYSGNQAVMNITTTSGGIFDTPTEVTEVNDGTIILTFTDCENGTVEYDIPSINQQGVVPIQRVVKDNIALCETLEDQMTTQQISIRDNSVLSSDVPGTVDAALPLVDMNAGLNDAWFYPVTNGQGFFITVFPDIGYVSLSWFTYDTVRPTEDVTANLGEPGHRWLNALGPYSGNQSVMDITITSGGIFDTATGVTEVNDGTIILTFTDCENGTVEYDIPSIDQQGVVPIQRVVGDNISLCEALNSD
jgi:hypothetical protein